MKVDAILDRYLEYLRVDKGKSTRSLQSVISQLRPVRRLLGRLPCELKAHQIDDYKLKRLQETTKRHAPVSRSTINRELTFLRAALRRAKRHELVSEVPIFDLYSESDCVRSGFIGPELMGRMLVAVRQWPDVADIMEFLYNSGWRRGEAETLTWDKISWDTKIICLPPGRKKEPARNVPIAGAIHRVLRRRWDLRTFDGALIPWVFHRRGRRFGSWRQAWRVAKMSVGRPELVVHDMRRSFTRNMAKRGVRRKVIMGITGHRTDAMFHRYQIVDEEDLRAALEQT